MTSGAASAAEALAELTAVARDPDAYVAQWKVRTGRRVFGLFPMHFPAEIVHAGGALPVLVQENREPDSLGRNLLAEFYCGYTRNVADQAAKGMLDAYDGFFLADHCTQLLGAVDVVRDEMPDAPVFLGQLPTSLTDSWAEDKARRMMQDFVDEMGRQAGAPITESALRHSIQVFNGEPPPAARDLRRTPPGRRRVHVEPDAGPGQVQHGDGQGRAQRPAAPGDHRNDEPDTR